MPDLSDDHRNMPSTDDKLKQTRRRPAASGSDAKDPGPRASGGAVARLLFRPVDITFLVYFRIAFGALMIWLGWQYYQYGMIDRYYVAPSFHITYYGFDWVKPWPAVESLGLTRGDMMSLHFLVLGVLAGCISAGLLYRASALLFCLGFAYVFLLEQARYLNHYYLIILISFLLVFLPAHRAFSLDALLRPALRTRTVPAWTLRILQFQIVAVYFFAGVTKCGSDWLHGEPMGSFLFDKQILFSESIRELMLRPSAALALAWSAMLLDLVIFPLFLWRKTRAVALTAAVLFHLMNTQLFHIDIFPWFMLASSVLFFFPDRLPLRNRGVPYFGTEAGDSDKAEPMSPRQRGIVALVGLYAAVQLLLPLRPYVYPGHTNWTFDGHAFSWRMLATSKHTDLDDPPQFYFRARREGRTVEAPLPLDAHRPDFDRVSWIRHWQFSRIAIRPDMLLRFAHIQADRLRAQGFDDVEIRAWVPVSLNGRPPQPIVDPEVDLAGQPLRFLTPYPWVLPLKTPLPPFERRRRLQERQIRQLELWQARIREAMGYDVAPDRNETPD